MATLTPNDENDLTKADASPTKAFFVHIMTKDIQLSEAIQDLVDNCIDGAKRLRPGEQSSFDGLEVRIGISGERLTIDDNCGGIPLDVARKYAFKFGRAEGFVPTTHSVGQFGVGMKRALFKMGHDFSVTSIEPHSSFQIRVNVDEWVSDNINWDFEIYNLDQRENEIAQTGTLVDVSNLDTSVSGVFKDPMFLSSLGNEIRTTQQSPMQRGLRITLNGEAINPLGWQLRNGEGLDSLFRRYSDELGGNSPLISRIFAGIGDSNKSLAGWYIFCNGRCILDADQTAVTGWSEVSEAGTEIPKYHGQFARFRGYAFLDSDDARLLPWNTTKTGLDLDSSAYRRLKSRLIEATRPVIDFLNQLDAELNFEPDDRLLTKAIANASPVLIDRLPERTVFSFVQQSKKSPSLATISYKKPQKEVDELKSALNAQSNKDLGESTFEYAYSNLVEDL